MPLDGYIPQIDDRRYDDIVTEIRTRIARYAPEWTPGATAWNDLNDNDPGITLVQVFAWLSEMLLYRMNQVPQLNYVKFLQLLGIELQPAEPAVTELEFPVKNDAPPVVLVPARTQVATEPQGGDPALIFETDRTLTALRAKLVQVQKVSGGSYTVVTDSNLHAEQGFYPFGSLANDGDALLLGWRDKDDTFPQVEVDLAVWVLPDPQAASAVSCAQPDNPAFAPARLRWEYCDGLDWRPLTLLKDETRAFTRSGHVHVKTPGQNAPPLQRAVFPNVTEALYWLRCRIEQSQYERPPQLLAIRSNTVPARQAETIKDEVLGGSNGRRDQPFQLEHTPVLHKTLRLEVNEGTGTNDLIWTRVDDFLGSGPNDRHYILDRTNGKLRFGDGRHGAIPVANVNNPDANIVAREYRFGGGRRGNGAAGTITSLKTTVPGVDDNAVRNLFAASGGRDEESLAEARQRAPLALRSRSRAVTAEDFEYLAMQAAHIKRAKALPLQHPSFPDVKVPGVVTVIVVPDGKAPNPIPSEGTLRAVCAYLDQRRLLTTELYVIKPLYQRVEVQAEVFVNDDADLVEVREGIEQTLLTYFHPLKGGEPRNGGAVGEGWPFGGMIFYSRVYQRVFTVVGVQSIQRLTILLDGEESQVCTDVTLKEGALTYSTQHSIDVQYRFAG